MIQIKHINGSVLKEIEARTLVGADLSGAYLRGADLSGADLSGADLSGADLGSQWIIQGPSRADGYFFLLQKLTNDNEPMIKAGCRYLTLQEANDHWKSTRANTPLGDETFAIIECLVKLAKARGLM